MNLLTDITPDELARLKNDLASGAKHPRQVKEDLAKDIVARYHSRAAAGHEALEFIRVHREKEKPKDIDEVTINKDSIPLIKFTQDVEEAGKTLAIRNVIFYVPVTFGLSFVLLGSFLPPRHLV